MAKIDVGFVWENDAQGNLLHGCQAVRRRTVSHRYILAAKNGEFH